jgi:hypothetical protein
MNLTRNFLFCLILLTLGGFSRFDIYEDVGNAIGAGDSKQLASHFGNTVELTILNRGDSYSKTQAELIVRDFFSKNPPKSFSIIHKGSSKEGTLFAIGTLTTTKGVVFRTSFFVRQSGKAYLVQELRFETE